MVVRYGMTSFSWRTYLLRLYHPLGRFTAALGLLCILPTEYKWGLRIRLIWHLKCPVPLQHSLKTEQSRVI